MSFGPNSRVAQTHSGVLQIRHMLAQIEGKLRTEMRREIFAWLGRSSPNERYSDSLKKRVHGTCEWVLERSEFQSWITVDHTTIEPQAKVLWINGPAGFGKTILCAHIVEHLSTTLEMPVVHFFFTADLESREDPYLAIRSWVSQIVSQQTDALEHVWGTKEYEIESTASRTTMIALLTQLLGVIPTCTLVADGLDECTYLDDSSNSVVSFLRDVIAAMAGTDARLLLVSRDEPQIRRNLMQDEIQRIVTEYKISPEDVRSDNVAHAEHIVNKKLPNKELEVRLSLSKAMADRCDGQFLWVALQEESLRGGMNKKKLQHVIETTPKGLKNVYEHNWARITQSGDWEQNQAFTLLRWAAFASRPLTVCEITEAALILNSGELISEDLPDAVDEEYVNTEIIGLCGPLIEVRTDSTESHPGQRKVYLPHFSIRQYLLERLPIPGWVQQNEVLQNSYEKLQHSVLAKACIQYIRLPQIWLVDSNTTDISLGASFRQYAATTWSHHVKSGLPEQADIRDLCIKFLTQENDTWMAWAKLMVEGNIKTGSGQKISFSCSPLCCAIHFQLVDLAISLIGEESVNTICCQESSPLCHACQSGLIDVVDVLLSKGARIDTPEAAPKTPLIEAAENGHLDIVKLLLQKGANVELADKHMITPLVAAAQHGHANVVQLLLENFTDMHAENASLLKSLVKASKLGYKETVEVLLRTEININAKVEGNSALFEASTSGNSDIVKILLDHGVDLAADKDEQGMTPLYAASYNGNKEVVKMLLEKGAKLEANDDRWAPLHSASSCGHAEVVKLLLQSGANVNDRTGDNWTALLLAAEGGHTKVVESLLESGADLKALHDRWDSVLLASCNGYEDIVELLLDHGADGKTAELTNWTSLHEAAKRGNIHIMERLIKTGIDVNELLQNGWSALHEASGRGHTKGVELLLDNGANIEIGYGNGWTPLHEACDHGKEEVVELLLRRGANAEALYAGGWTPLHAASEKGYNKDIIELLLKGGANIGAAYRNCMTPLFIASEGGHKEIVELFIKHGVSPTSKCFDHGYTPMLLAAMTGQVEVVKLLLEASTTTISIPDNFGRLPLFYAARNGHDDVVRILVSKCPVESGILSSGWMDATPLFAAVVNGHARAARLLVETNANKEKQQHVGKSLMWWARRTGDSEIMDLLKRTEVVEDDGSDGDASEASRLTAFEKNAPWCDACTVTIKADAAYECRAEGCDKGLCVCQECFSRGVHSCMKDHPLSSFPIEFT